VFTRSIFITYALDKPHVRRRSKVGAGGHGPSKFLEYLVSLCFKRQHLKQNTVVRLKSHILTHPKILGMPCHCARKYLNSCFIWVILGFLWTKDE